MLQRFERFTFCILQISKYWHKLATDEMKPYGLKGNHAVYLLAMLQHPHGITAPELCEICAKDKADVSRMMSILESKGLVIKQGMHQNLYQGNFLLTDQGKDIAEVVKKRAALAVELAGKELNDTTRTIFYESLSSITENLKILSQNGLPKE